MNICTAISYLHTHKYITPTQGKRARKSNQTPQKNEAKANPNQLAKRVTHYSSANIKPVGSYISLIQYISLSNYSYILDKTLDIFQRR